MSTPPEARASRAAPVPTTTSTGMPRGHWLRGILTVLLVVAAFLSSWSGFRVGGANASDLALLAAVPVAFVLRLLGSPAPASRRWMYAPAAAAVVVAAWDVVVLGLPLGAASNTGQAAEETVLLVLMRIVLSTSAIAFCVTGLGIHTGPALWRLASAWLAGACLSAACALAQARGFTLPSTPLIAQVIGTTSDRYPGLASHPNTLAQASVIALPVAVAFLCRARGVRTLAPLTALAVLAACVPVSGSRAGLLVGAMVVVAIVVTLLAHGRRLEWLLPISLLTIAWVLVYGAPLVAETRLNPDLAGVAQSNAGRLASVQDGWALFSQSPVFGSGLGSWFGAVSPLILLAGGGVVLLTAYTWFWAAPTIGLWRDRSSLSSRLALTTALAIVGFATLNNGLFERFTFWPLILAFVISADRVGARDQVLSPGLAVP